MLNLIYVMLNLHECFILSTTHIFEKQRSVRVAERLALPSLDHEVPGSNPARDGIQHMTVRHIIAPILSSIDSI